VAAADLQSSLAKFVTTLLAECVEKPADSYDLLGGLFRLRGSVDVT
jgi:hypothetical protein